MTMKQTSATLLLEGKRQVKSLGDVCDASCFVWYTCTNSKSNGKCEGFLLLHNGDVKRHLNKILNDDDVVYVQNCVRMLQQNGCCEETKETLVKEVLRFIPQQSSQRQEGFLNMLEASHPTSEKQEPQESPKTEFQRMLEASGKNNQPTIERQIIPIDFASQFPDVCDPTKCPPNYARHCRANTEGHHGLPCIYVTLKNR